MLDALEAAFGPVDPPELSDPWLLVLDENIAYLATKDARRLALAELEDEVGSSPEAILGALDDRLHAAVRRGIVRTQTVEKLRSCARIAVEQFNGDLVAAILPLPFSAAKRALMKFPSIGEPGAEKILLIARRESVLPLDSNGLRVLTRLGFLAADTPLGPGDSPKNYTKAYRQAQQAASAELARDAGVYLRAYQLLRRHGETICRRTNPHCEGCPLASGCRYYLDQVETS
jgi:endonuclease III